MANELSVELKLKLDKLRQQSQQAGRDINQYLASSVKGLPATSMEKDNADKEAQKKRERAARNAKLDEKDRQREEAEEEKHRRKRQAALAQMIPQIAVLYAAIKSLQKVFQELASAADTARKNYAKILQSGGMAGGFVIQRAQLAEIIGVSDQQVMQYGQAIAYLNEKLEFSHKIFTDTNQTLTALSWHFKILEQNTHAMWASLANDAAPAIHMLIDALDQFVKYIVEHRKTILGLIGWNTETPEQTRRRLDLDFFSKNYITAMEPLMEMDPFSGETPEEYIERFRKTFGTRSRGATELVAKESGVAPVIAKMLTTWLHEAMPKAMEAPKAPAVAASLNRLPASNWERMGLIIGPGGAIDHAKRTADNTTKLVQLTGQLIHSIIPHSGKPNFFENPTYSQP